MKKILSLALAAMMVVSVLPVAYAAETVDYTAGTSVAANGSRTTIEDDGSVTHDVAYTIKVPAKLAPDGSGTVTLEGSWPSNATVTVTAEEKVELVNSISGADKKELTITFPGIVKAGDNTQAVSASATVKVAGIDAALFGTWEGVFNYNVVYADSTTSGGESGGTTTEPTDPDTGDDGEEATIINFTIDGTEYQAEEGMTWTQWVESEYSNSEFEIGQYGSGSKSIVKTGDDSGKMVRTNGLNAYALGMHEGTEYTYA